MTEKDGSGGNGKAVPEAGPTEQEIFAHVAGMILQQLAAAAPFAPPGFAAGDPEAWEKAAAFLADEQMRFNTETLPRLASADDEAEHVCMEFVRMRGDGEGMRMTAPRSIVGVDDINTAVRLAMIYALMDSPVARAILRCNGFAYRVTFPDKPPLVLL